MIEKCIKWQESLCLGDRTNLYFVLLTNGKVYCYNRHEGWQERKIKISINWDEFTISWKPCTPLEVVVVCGIKGLK